MSILAILFWVAIFAGGLLILLLLLSIAGGLDMEVDIDTGSSTDTDSDGGGLGVVKSLLTFVSVGSWVMRIMLASNKAPVLAVAMGIFTGVLAILILHHLIKFLLKNEENVNWSMQDAIFQNGTVYLKIPKDGDGIVQIEVKGAYRELKAKSHNNKDIPTGASVMVVEISDEYVIVENK